MAIDPVCGMDVDPTSATQRVEHEGETILFCSESCRTKFLEHPDRFRSAAAPAGRHGHRGTAGDVEPADGDYTCPMHPEVVQDQPGSCPKCGMALEPRTVTVDEEESQELVDMRRRLWISAAFALPLLVLSMGELIPGVSFAGLASARTIDLIELALATPVVLWGARPFFVRAWRSVATWNLNMFTLIGLGVGVAYVYSVIAALFPDLFPASFHDVDGNVAVYFEAAAVITALVLLG